MKTKAYKPDGTPRYLRVYDGPKYDDRYTVVYTRTNDGICHYLGMNAYPFHGLGSHGESNDGMIDRPRYSHLGKKITFDDLPPDCKRAVMLDYVEIWGAPPIIKEG